MTFVVLFARSKFFYPNVDSIPNDIEILSYQIQDSDEGWIKKKVKQKNRVL